MCSSRIEKRRAETADQSEWTRLLRRQEKALSRVAKTVLRTILRLEGRILRQVREVEKIVLGNNGADCTYNQLPIFANSKRNARLTVKSELALVPPSPLRPL